MTMIRLSKCTGSTHFRNQKANFTGNQDSRDGCKCTIRSTLPHNVYPGVLVNVYGDGRVGHQLARQKETLHLDVCSEQLHHFVSKN